MTETQQAELKRVAHALGLWQEDIAHVAECERDAVYAMSKELQDSETGVKMWKNANELDSIEKDMRDIVNRIERIGD